MFPKLLMGHVQCCLKNQHNENRAQFFSLQIRSLSQTLIYSSNVYSPCPHTPNVHSAYAVSNNYSATIEKAAVTH